MNKKNKAEFKSFLVALFVAVIIASLIVMLDSRNKKNLNETNKSKEIIKKPSIEMCEDIKIDNLNENITAQYLGIKENYTDSGFMTISLVENLKTDWKISGYEGSNWNLDKIKSDNGKIEYKEDVNPGIVIKDLSEKVKFIPDKDKTNVKLGMMYQNGMYNMVESDSLNELVIGHSSDLYLKGNKGNFTIKMVLDNPKDGEEPIYEISGKSDGDLAFIRNKDKMLIIGNIKDGNIMVYGDKDLLKMDLEEPNGKIVIKRSGKDLIQCNL